MDTVIDELDSLCPEEYNKSFLENELSHKNFHHKLIQFYEEKGLTKSEFFVLRSKKLERNSAFHTGLSNLSYEALADKIRMDLQENSISNDDSKEIKDLKTMLANLLSADLQLSTQLAEFETIFLLISNKKKLKNFIKSSKNEID